MAGVYIPGMKMPTSCDECPLFNLDIDGGCYCTKYFVIRKKDQDRPDWCPLIEVPPHGRLIDADDKINQLKTLMEQVSRPFQEVLYQYAINLLGRCPTIIQADRRE